MTFWWPTESAIFFSIRYRIPKSQNQFMIWRFFSTRLHFQLLLLLIFLFFFGMPAVKKYNKEEVADMVADDTQT